MASEVVNEELAAAIDHVAAGVAMLRAANISPADSVDALAVIRETERLGRQLDAVQVAVIGELDRSGVYATDGHRSAKVMAGHVGRLSNREAGRRAGVARALRDLPAVAAGHASGLIGSCQVSLVARVHANKRVRARLIEIDTDLARSAAHRSYREFELLLRNWESLTDEDGCADRNQRNHENRDAKVMQDFDMSWHLEAGCASVQGAVLHDIFQHFVDAEFAADWDAARAEWGDAAGTHLPRTAAQRRFDALFRLFQRAADAAAAETGGSRTTPTSSSTRRPSSASPPGSPVPAPSHPPSTSTPTPPPLMTRPTRPTRHPRTRPAPGPLASGSAAPPSTATPSTRTRSSPPPCSATSAASSSAPTPP